MKMTWLELRRNPGKILEAIERKETVTLSMRGHEIALIVPKPQEQAHHSIKDSPAFGLWKDREDLQDPAAHVRQLRRRRYNDL